MFCVFDLTPFYDNERSHFMRFRTETVAPWMRPLINYCFSVQYQIIEETNYNSISRSIAKVKNS